MEESSGKGLSAHINSSILVDAAAIKRDRTAAADAKTAALRYTCTAVLQARSLPGSFFQWGNGRKFWEGWGAHVTGSIPVDAAVAEGKFTAIDVGTATLQSHDILL